MLLIRAWDLNVYLISLNNIQSATISKRVHICYQVVKMYLKLTSPFSYGTMMSTKTVFL